MQFAVLIEDPDKFTKERNTTDNLLKYSKCMLFLTICANISMIFECTLTNLSNTWKIKEKSGSQQTVTS